MQLLLKKPFVYISAFALLILLISTISGLINYILINKLHFNIKMNNHFATYPIWQKVIVGSVGAPIIETYLFQQLPYTFLKKWNVNNNIIILISSTLFALTHFYSISYIIFAFFAGIILIKAFINWEGTMNNKYLVTAGIHCMANTCVTILSIFFC